MKYLKENLENRMSISQEQQLDIIWNILFKIITPEQEKKLDKRFIKMKKLKKKEK